MTKQITVTEFCRSFSEVIGQVYYKGESFKIKKGKRIVARLAARSKYKDVGVRRIFFVNALI